MSRSFRSLRGALLGSSLAFAFTNAVAAQDVPPQPADPAPAPIPPAAITPQQTEEGEHPVHPETPTAESHPVPLEAEPSWADDLSIGAFVDAYAAWRSDNNAQHDLNGTAPGSVVNVSNGFGHDAYVEASGFALAFAGADIAYSGEQFGATISLRFGPGVNRFYAADQGVFGLDNITQAYATWKPSLVKGLTLDLGQFYTIYGAEVAESWRNMNYSRGALYYAMQPFWHTGLRANYLINDMFSVNAMVVNGVNTAFEGNKSPTLGIQLLATPIDELFLAVGYMTGLTPRDGDDETAVTGNFQDFVDVVATLTLGDFKVVGNFDFNSYRVKGASDRENWWGISVAPGYSFTNWFGVAGRVEYLVDSANSQLAMGWLPGGEIANAVAAKTLPASFTPAAPGDNVHLTTLTATLDLKPVPNSTALVLRPEFRYEIASEDNYLDHDNDPTKNFWSLHLGAVVTSM